MAVEYLIRTVPVVLYDGTNGAEIVTASDPSDQNEVVLVSEVDGVGTFSYNGGGFTATVMINAGDYVAASGGWPYVITGSSLDGYAKLSDLENP